MITIRQPDGRLTTFDDVAALNSAIDDFQTVTIAEARDADFEHWADGVRAGRARLAVRRMMFAALIAIGLFALVVGAILARGI